MTETRKLIERQVTRVRRRLLLRTFLHAWMWTTAGALSVSALAYLARPFFFAAAPDWLTWALPAGLVGLGTIIAAVWANKTGPSFVASALALDHAFDLRERVTTFCTLTKAAADSGVGQLLVEDVRTRVAGLDVRSQFPVRVRWLDTLWPLAAGALAIAASFFDPSWIGATAPTPLKKSNVVNAREVQEQIDNLRKVSTNKDKDELKTEKLKELEEAWNKLLDKQLDPNDQEKIRERANEMRTLEEKMKDRIRDLKAQTEKNKEIKNALDQLAKDLANDKNAEKGPMKDLQDALAKHDLAKAEQILEQLAKDLANDKLSKDEQKDLANKMKDIQEKLGKLANQKEQKKKLQRDRKDAQKQMKEWQDKLKKLTDGKEKDGLKRLLDDKQQELDKMENELDNLEDLAQDLQDLQELADALDECQECMGKGDKKGAGNKLQKAMQKLKEMKLTDQELKQLTENQQALEEARLAMLRACQGDGNNPNGNKLGGMGKQASKNPGGVRPSGPDPKDAKIVDDRLKGQPDPKGKHRITGFSRGGTFQKIPSAEVGGAFTRVQQEAADALDRQRIPPEAADLAKGYFNKVGGQNPK